MKLKNILMAAAAIFTLGFVASCDHEYEPTYLGSIKVSRSYVTFAQAGGSESVQITSSSDWYFELSKADSAWLTLSQGSGSGSQEVTFTAPEATDTRETVIKLHSGAAVQYINVKQQCAAVEMRVSSCAEVNAGADGKTYRVCGTVTGIANTVYGNFYINDGTGEVYVYGTLYAGKTQNNPIVNNNIALGDVVTVEGPKKTYNGTVELCDVEVINVEKSTVAVSAAPEKISVEKGDTIVEFAVGYMGESLVVKPQADWITLYSINITADSAFVSIKVAANEAAGREGKVLVEAAAGEKVLSIKVTVAQAGAIEDLTCAGFNKREDGTAEYRVHGVITTIANTKYGNLYINDGTDSIYVYGITGWDATKYKVGDEVILQSIKTSYKGTNQMKNAVVVEQVAHETKTVAELKEAEDATTVFYYVTGVVCHSEGANDKFDLEKYGNFGLKDETGTIYVYGVANALDGVTKSFNTCGVKEGDTITMLAYKTSYNGNPQIVGKFLKKKAAATAEE